MRAFVCLFTLALLAAIFLPQPIVGQLPVDGELKNHPPKLKSISSFDSPVDPVAGGARPVSFNFTAVDPNGWQDIAGAVVKLYAPDNSTFLRYANVTSAGGGNGASQDFTARFSMMYWDPPAMGNESYFVEVQIEDRRGATSEPGYATFEYTSAAAMSLSSASLDFGEVAPGERSEPFEIVVFNRGNVVLDLELSGTDLVGEGIVLPVDRIRYGTQGAEMVNETALAWEPRALTGFLQPGEDAQRSVHWVLDLPSGSERYMPAGAYSGEVLLSISEE